MITRYYMSSITTTEREVQDIMADDAEYVLVPRTSLQWVTDELTRRIDPNRGRHWSRAAWVIPFHLARLQEALADPDAGEPVDAIPMQPQRRSGLGDQLNVVRRAAMRLGCYDAADFIIDQQIAPGSSKLSAEQRRAVGEQVTREVAREMQEQGYAYWSEYDENWQTKRHPRIEGIVFAVLRAFERRGMIQPAAAPRTATSQEPVRG